MGMCTGMDLGVDSVGMMGRKWYSSASGPMAGGHRHNTVIDLKCKTGQRQQQAEQ
jgi:hypothetical protein